MAAPGLRPGAAAAWMLAAGLLFAFMDAGMKWLASNSC